MARPAIETDFATDPASIHTEPTAETKALGLIAHDVLPAGFLNWIFYKLGVAVNWLLSNAVAADETNAWTAIQHFNASADVLDLTVTSDMTLNGTAAVKDAAIRWTGPTTALSNPVYNEPLENVLCPGLSPKAFCRIRVDAGVIQGTDGIIAGRNIDHAAFAPGYTELAVHFAAPMADTDFAVIPHLGAYTLGSGTIQNAHLRVSGHHTGYFFLTLHGGGGSLIWNDSGTVAELSLVVFGTQTTV